MQASAFVIGSANGQSAALLTMARQLGFAAVFSYSSIELSTRQARHTPICFFLFAAVSNIDTLRGTASAIRFANNHKVRFAPLIYFARTPAVETIQHCINLGFDDVVSLPIQPPALGVRLARQVETPLDYYETATYFGPDRRDRVKQPPHSSEQRGAGQFRRLEIVRSLTKGIAVSSTELGAFI